MSDMTVSLILKLVDEFTRPGSKARNTLKGVKKAADEVKRGFSGAVKAGLDFKNVTKAIERNRTALEKNNQALQKAKGRLMGAAAAAVALALPIRQAVKFESAMADVKKVLNDVSEADFKKLTKDLRVLTREVPKTHIELAAIMAKGAASGIPKDELIPFASDAAKLMTAFDMSADEAASTMTGMRSIFGLNQEAVVGLGDAVNTLGNNFDARERDIFKILIRAGQMGKDVKMSAASTAALATTFLELKTQSEVAGTAINAMLLKLSTPHKQGKRFTEALQSMGYDVKDFAKRMNEDGQGTLVEFLEKLKTAEDSKGLLVDMFGLEYSDDIGRLVGALDIYKRALAKVSDKTKIAGAMQREYEERLKTTEEQYKLTKNRAADIAIFFGSVLLPAVNDILRVVADLGDSFSDFAEKNPGLTKAIVFAIAGFMSMLIVIRLVSFAVLTLKGAVLAGRGAILALIAAMSTGGKLAFLIPLLKGIGLAMRAVGLAFLTSPIGWIAAGIAAAAYLVYKNWDKVKSLLAGFWNNIKAVWSGAKQWLTGLFDIDLTSSGQKIIQSLINGLMAKWNALKEKVAAMAQTVRNYWPFSPAKEGPLRDLHKVKIAETIASSINPSALRKAVDNLARQSLQPVKIAGAASLVAGAPVAGQTVAAAPSTNITITVSVNANSANGKEIGQQIADAVQHKLRSSLHDGVNSR